jgi:hypothetical protein
MPGGGGPFPQAAALHEYPGMHPPGITVFQNSPYAACRGLLLINIFPNNTIKSHKIITTNAAPHLILSRSTAPGISFVKDACAVEVLGTLGPVTPADEFFGATSASFLTEGCGVGLLGSSSAFLCGTSPPPMVPRIELPRLVLIA